MPGFTGDLDVDLERGLAECASKTIMTHIPEKGLAALLEVAILRELAIAADRCCALAAVRTPPDGALHISVLIAAPCSSPVASRRPDPLEGEPPQ